MQYISCESAQSLQLIHMDEARPLRGGLFFPDFAAQVVQRYRFQSVPARADQNQPAKFLEGVLEADGLTIPISSLEIYVDGVLVNGRNTEDADIVISDFLIWILEHFTLREPKTLVPKRYISRVIVDFDQSVGAIFLNKFQTMAKIISEAFGAERRVELTQMQFGLHPPTELPMLSTWILQPRIGQPPAPNRYFSIAPLSTPDHVQMLHKLEEAVLS